MDKQTWKVWAGRALLLGAGLLLGLLGAEAGLRLLGVSFPQPYVPDRFVGVKLQPHFAGWFTKEGRAYVQVNSAGFRDRPRQPEKPDGTFRIAVLGDSFIEAVQVQAPQTFTAQLESRLNSPSWNWGEQVEVLNFGISGHGTAQQLQMLRHYVWDYDPNLIVLAFFAGNDVRNNSPVLEPDQRRPFFQLTDGRLVLDDRFLAHPDFKKAMSPQVQRKVSLINRFRVLQVAAEWRSRQRSQRQRDTRVEAGLDQDVFRAPTTASWTEAWDITESLIETMAHEVRDRAARLLVVTIPSAIQVHPEPDVRRQFEVRHQIDDLDYADRRIAALTDRVGLDVLTLAEPLREIGESQQLYLYGFENTQLGTGHWNEVGQREAAKVVARAVGELEGGRDASPSHLGAEP